MIRFSRVAAGLLLLGVACGYAQQPSHQHPAGQSAAPMEGVVVLVPTQGNHVQGMLSLKQHDGFVQVTGEVTGLTPGKHGFHIHEFGDLRDPAGASAGGHFNPSGDPHGGLHSEKHHAGDLGNIAADSSGIAKVDIEAPGLELHYVLGRSIVVHAGEDDLKSQPAGDSGARVAVGVIGIAQVKKP